MVFWILELELKVMELGIETSLIWKLKNIGIETTPKLKTKIKTKVYFWKKKTEINSLKILRRTQHQ